MTVITGDLELGYLDLSVNETISFRVPSNIKANRGTKFPKERLTLKQ